MRHSIRLGRRCALVTGSNMAGKTTFVKVLGINVILGRTVGFCLAGRALLLACVGFPRQVVTDAMAYAEEGRQA